MSRQLCALALMVLIAAAVPRAEAQGGNAPNAPRSARDAAPIDLTGYWVSIVTQDWRWRMVTPARGDYLHIPMTAAAKAIADAWDPARDEAAGEACKSYGAPALMSVPGRLRISWEDDNTLKVESDAGMQTRLFHFGGASVAEGTARSWQGQSAAEWDVPGGNVPTLLRPQERQATDDLLSGPRGGSLEVVTTNLRAGYLRKNGVPYSENAVLTEFWDLFQRPNGEEWLTITTQVEDPEYLRVPRLIAPTFKKEPNGANWDPVPCSATW